MNTFIPCRHRPILPRLSNVDQSDDIAITINRNFRLCAWVAYWEAVNKIREKKNVGILEARNLFHATGVLPKRSEQRKAEGDDSFWTADDMMVCFMLQFEKWQQKKWNINKLLTKDRLSCDLFNTVSRRGISLEAYFARFPLSLAGMVVDYLMIDDRLEDVKSLLDDPIFGDDAGFELRSRAILQNHAIDEFLRIAQSHEHVQEIDGIIRAGSPSNYNVDYPYSEYGGFGPESGKKFHSIPNCLNVSADGSPLFRLEVLDTVGLTKYRLAELRKPWWGETAPLFESPKNEWEGEYDFDFKHFGINEGDEFDHETFVKVMKHGIDRIKTRASRKYGNA